MTIFTTFYEPYMGGAEYFVREVTSRLSNNCSFNIITARLNRRSPAYESINRISVHRVGIGCKWDKYLYPILSVVKAVSLKCDIVHGVMASYAGLAMLMYSKIARKPSLLTLQSGTMDSPSYKRKLNLISLVYKKIHTSAARVHAISSSLKGRAIKLGCSRDDVYVIPNGVDLERFKPTKSNLRSNFKPRYLIVCVARLVPVKGINYLIKAIPPILEEVNVGLLLIGDGPEKNKLMGIVDELGLEDRVHFLGSKSHDELPTYLSMSDVFICPSLFEGMGSVFVEAMACRIPVVGTNVGGIPDVIQDNVNGLLIEPQDSSQIAKAVLKILGNKDLADKLAENGRRIALEKYSWDKVSEDIHMLYKEILDTSN